MEKEKYSSDFLPLAPHTLGTNLPELHVEQTQKGDLNCVPSPVQFSSSHCPRHQGVKIKNHLQRKTRTTRMGFEPTRAKHNGLAVHRLNHSATSSSCSLFLGVLYFRVHTWEPSTLDRMMFRKEMVWRRLGDVASTRMDKAPDCKSCDGGPGRGEGGKQA